MTKANGSVALTSDSGSERGGTSDILEILRQANLQITVFDGHVHPAISGSGSSHGGRGS